MISLTPITSRSLTLEQTLERVVFEDRLSFPVSHFIDHFLCKCRASLEMGCESNDCFFESFFVQVASHANLVG